MFLWNCAHSKISIAYCKLKSYTLFYIFKTNNITVRCFSEDVAIECMIQILNGFKGLHQHGIIHRDFKL